MPISSQTVPFKISTLLTYADVALIDRRLRVPGQHVRGRHGGGCYGCHVIAG